MYNINRDYLIVLNPKTSKVTVPELNYYIYDKYTANLFVNLVTVENGKAVNIPDADQYKLVLHVLKPTNEIQDVENIELISKEKALFQIELNQELTKNIGRYKCELLTIDKNDHVVQSAKFSYRVKKSIYNDLDVVTETPQYPIIITLLNKLQDIDKYEEERRANEVARVAAEKARVKDYTDLRQTVTTDINTMQEKIDSFDGKVQEVDSAVQQMRTNITNYQTEKNKELDNYKTQKDTQINTSIKNMENTIDTYKTEKDKQINDKISQQDTKIDKAIDLQNKNIQASTKALNDKLDAAVQDQNDTIAANNQAQNKVISDAVAAQNKTINTVVESDKVQNDRLDTLETSDTNNKAEIKKLQDKDVEHEERMTVIEAVDVEQNNRLDAIEIKNDQQDSRLNDVEAKNKKQDLDLKCLFAESHSERITLDDEVGNSVFLQNSKQGFATVDELKGNTLVNCNKDTDKELILNGNIDTSGYGTVTTTEGVDGGLVDVALEGNTMVNVCDQEEPIAITKSYEVTTGNHVALQGEYDGKCRPVLNGNTLVNCIRFNRVATSATTVEGNKYIFTRRNVTENNTATIFKSTLKDNTKYTLAFDIIKNDFINGDYEGNRIEVIRRANTGDACVMSIKSSVGHYIYTFTTNFNDTAISDNTDEFWIGVQFSDLRNHTEFLGEIIIGNVIVLEGDYTNKPIPDYFTGLQSSFEDNYVPENLYKFSSRDDFYLLDNNVTLDGEYIKMTANSAYQNAMLKPLTTIKPSTTYTIVVDVVENTLDSKLVVTAPVDDVQLTTEQTFKLDAGKTGIFTQVVTTKNDLSGCTRCLVNYLADTNTTGSIKYKIMVVEGDYTNYDFTNYDSSKGGKYKVDYKVTGKNKFDKSKTLDGYEISNEGHGTINTNTKWFITDFIPVIPNTSYTISGKSNGNVVMCYNENKQSMANITSGGTSYITIPNNVRYIKLNGFLTQKDTFQIEEGDTATTYEPYKEYTKTFYLNSPLLKGDTIEDVNGKATHVHRYKSVVLDGSDDENYTIQSINANGIVNFLFHLVNNKLPLAIGDDFGTNSEAWLVSNYVIDNNNISNAKTTGCLPATNKAIYIRELASNYDTIEKFKNKLKNTPTTIVYPLAKPTYETISNDSILCDSYVNGHLDVDSIVPVEKVVFGIWGQDIKYMYTSTDYILQFESDNVGKIDVVYTTNKGCLRNLDVIKGVNKFTFTSNSSFTSSWFTIQGIGFNMSKVVVTPKVEQTFGYFKGMKSVGQDDVNGNKIEILSNNKNLWNWDDLYNQYGSTNANLYKKFNGTLTKINNDEYCIVPHQGGWYEQGIFSTPIYLKSGDSVSFSGMAKGCRNVAIYKLSDFLIPLPDFINFDENSDEYQSFNTSYTVDKDGYYVARFWINNNHKGYVRNIQFEKSSVSTTYIEPKLNKKEITLNEPLRALPNGVKDKIVIIDGKWYIERNCMAVQFKDLKYSRTDVYQKAEFPDVIGFRLSNTGIQPPIMCDRFAYTNDRIINFGELLTNKEAINITSSNTMDEFFITINKTKLTTLDSKGLIKYFTDNPMEIITKATTPTYEPIEYNSFEVYSNTTHISNNSNIPCNMVIRNSGFNCMIKPNTTYTVSSNNGLSSVVTKASIGDSVLRFYDKDTTSVTKMSNVLVLEGDYITGNPPIPAFFKGMESTFEQELVTDEKDKNYGKYKVNVKAVGKNLFNKDTVIKGKYQNSNIANNNFRISSNPEYKITDFIPVREGVKYYNHVGKGAYYIDKNTPIESVGVTFGTFTPPKGAKYVVLTNNVSTDWSNEVICPVDLYTEYEPYKENNITFYIKEPLRGVGDVKDKVYVKEDKVVVERNCTSVTFDGSDDEEYMIVNEPNTGQGYYRTRITLGKIGLPLGNYLKFKTNNFTINEGVNNNFGYICTFDYGSYIFLYHRFNNLQQSLQANPTTVVYQLATPTYEEVEYFDLKLFVEIFKDTTIIYNSNIPVTSTINYTYATPLTDAVNTVSDISDQQDSMIIDMATQVATMEMMLM